MARLIRKEDVGLYGGDTVYLETKYGSGLVTIVSLSYRENEDGSETIHSVEWSADIAVANKKHPNGPRGRGLWSIFIFHIFSLAILL